MENVVYFVVDASEQEVRATASAMDQTARELSPVLSREVRFHVENALPRVLAKLRLHGADALIVDARREVCDPSQSKALELLRELYREHEVAGPVSRARTWLVAPSSGLGARMAFEAGRLRIGGTIPLELGDPGWVAIWRQLDRAVQQRRGGKTAICLAGGGIEGGFYEVGVLRALQFFLPEFSLANVDIICGISVGSIIGAFLANGLSPDEIMRGMKLGEGRLDKLGKSAAFDPNVREFAKRFGRGMMSAVRGKASLQTMLQMIPSGAFGGTGIHRYLEQNLTKPGMIDRFPDLPRKLYVGATDQDTMEHVVFGSPGWDHIPIHEAVRASAALAPFYAPQCIEGRYYIDGAFTRTTDIRVAVEHGATLIIVVDPLVPIVSERSGYVASKGAIMGTMQALKSMIHGRFGAAAEQLRARFPNVALHLFQPDGAAMRLMAGSPMKFFYRTEIEDITYRQTIRSVRQRLFPALQNDFARHSIAFVDPDASLGSIKRDLLDEADEVLVA
jgi:predicted acylesterase/phospholipase RssA